MAAVIAPSIATRARLLLAGVGALLVVYVAHGTLGLGGDGLDDVVKLWLYHAALLACAGLCLARGLLVRPERAAWLLLGTAIALWTAGNVYFVVVLYGLDPVPLPSPSDALWLSIYPPAYAGIALLVSARFSGWRLSMSLDGVIAALAAGAVSAAIGVQAALGGVDGDAAVAATNLAYPICDLILLACVAGATALGGWRSGRAWALLAAGLATFAVADGAYLVQVMADTYVEGSIVSAGWLAAALLIATGAWVEPAPRRAVDLEGLRVLLLPAAFAVIGLAVLVVDHFRPVNVVALGLATACLVAVIARTVVTCLENVRILRRTREESLTDPLTGLGNRRRLMADLDGAKPFTTATPLRLMLFDLNGFKAYNDSYGHPAGDVLLARLGARLAAAVDGRGRAYRMGGDEFCALVQDAAKPFGAPVEDAALAALSERGEGFAITCAHGSIRLPDEAVDPASALQLVDMRMYEDKRGGRPSTGRQSTDVVLRVLAARHPDLDRHLSGVADLCDALAGALGLPHATREHVRLAAELHDVGKIAVPDAILSKAGPLDGPETAFMREHTLIGERILDGAPGLSAVARLVRSSHEHMDGSGYPDGLAGGEIPIGSRIVAVCDAFAVMTVGRPSRHGMTPDAALVELERAAGSQFDPTVVEALRDVLVERGAGHATPRRHAA
jgi:diguanylate cyclase (GGDEF)-like protein